MNRRLRLLSGQLTKNAEFDEVIGDAAAVLVCVLMRSVTILMLITGAGRLHKHLRVSLAHDAHGKWAYICALSAP